MDNQETTSRRDLDGQEDVMHEDNPIGAALPSTPEPTIEQQIRLEKARKETLETELKLAEQSAKSQRSKQHSESKGRLNKIKLKGMLPAIAATAVVVTLIFTVVVPLISKPPQNIYLSASSLEQVVNIEQLSSLDYTYAGIAQKDESPDSVKIKYEAHIRVGFDMSQIRFEVDEQSNTVHAYLPDPVINPPELNADAFGYIPENADEDLETIIQICEADALAGTADSPIIKEKAYENLENTIRALTLPLVEGYDLKFHLSDAQAEVTDDEE